jgi:plastocyanin domain-containing protein
MNPKPLALVVATVAMVVLPGASWAQCGHCGHADHHGSSAGQSHSHESEPGADTARTVALAVTAEGFSPSTIRLQRGEAVTLVITRTTDETCAKEIVIPDYAVRKALPLGQPVAIELTPSKTGTVRYTCGMDMVSGVLVVE